MTTEHTPGPWRIGDAGNTVFGPKTAHPSPVSVCAISGPTPRLSPDEKRANARLISAAPDLLEALRAIAEACEANADSTMGEGWVKAHEKFGAFARKAIAKATEKAV